MADPKLGMHYNDVRKRVKRLEADDRAGKVKDRELKARLKESLLNQCRLHEGEAAVDEINRELDYKGSVFSGADNRSCGYGNGVKGSGGHYEWDSQQKQWVKK